MTELTVGILLADVQKERVSWRSRGRIARGKLHTLEGDPGLGKSTLLTQFAADVSRGLPLPEGDPQPERGVILICAEDDPGDTIRPRFEAAGGDVNEVVILRDVPYLDSDGNVFMRMFELPTDAELLEQIIRERNVGLVIVDPFALFMADDLSENSNKDVRKCLTPLELIAQRTGASIIVVRHLNKGGGTNAIYRGGGSIGILAAARLGLLLAEDPRDKEVKCLARVKGNLGREPRTLQFRLIDVPGDEVAKVEWLPGFSDLTADDLLMGKAVGVETMDEWDEATVWLKDYLSGGPKPNKHLARDASTEKIGPDALKKAKARLRVKYRKDGFGGGWETYLPAEPKATNGYHKPGDDGEYL